MKKINYLCLLISFFLFMLGFTGYSQNSNLQDSPEQLGEALFRAYVDSNLALYKSYYPSEDEIKQYVMESNLSDEDKDLEVGHKSYELFVRQLVAGYVMERFFADCKKLNFNPRHMKYDSLRIKKKNVNDVELADIAYIFNIKGQKHELRFNDLFHIKKGWYFLGIGFSSVYDTILKREKKDDKTIKPEVTKVTIQPTDGFPNRFVINAEGNKNCNWTLTVCDAKGMEKESYKTIWSKKPQWVVTPEKAGDYTLKFAIDDSTAKAERTEKLTVANILKEKKVFSWTLSGTEKESFYRSNIPQGTPSGELDLARGEMEALQVAYVLSFDSRVDIRFDNPDFEYKVYRIGYVDCRPNGLFEKENRIADVLAPMNSFRVKKGDLEAIYIDFKARKGTKPGIHEGNIIMDFGGIVQKVPVKLHLYNVEIPKEIPIKTAFTAFTISDKIYSHNKRMYDSLLHCLYDNHITPDLLYRAGEPLTIDDVKQFIRLTGNATFSNIFYIYEKNVATWEEKLPKIKEVVDYIYTNRLEDQFYFYMFDESPSLESFKLMKKTTVRLKELFPKTKILTTATVFRYRGYTEKIPGLDLWCPVTNDYDQYKLDSNKYTWWYICCGPPPPYANWFVESDLTEPRILWWQCWQYTTEGFLYYSVDLWGGDRKPISDGEFPLVSFKPACFENYNGDGNLVYPGTKNILASMRLKSIRDGIDDLALLKMAEKKLGKKVTMDYTKRISRTVSDFDHDAHKLLQVRKELLNELEKNSKF